MCDIPIPNRYKTIAIARAALKEAIENEKGLLKLKEKIIYLKKMGGYIGKIRTAKAQDVLYDVTDLDIMYDSTCKKLAKKSQAINKLSKQRLLEEKQQRMNQMDTFHKAKYMEIMEAADQKMGELAECGQLRSQEALSTDLAVINRIMKEDLPKWRNSISSEMAKASVYLTENDYDSARLVSERETTLVEMLKQTEERAVKILTKVQGFLGLKSCFS